MADLNNFLPFLCPKYVVSVAIGPPFLSPKAQKVTAMACVVWALWRVWGGALLDSSDKRDGGFSEEGLAFSQLPPKQQDRELLEELQTKEMTFKKRCLMV